MKKQYSPAEVRNFLNISRSAMRYYKEKGLISNEKNESNGYSYYSGSDFLEIIDVGFFRNCLDANADDIHSITYAESAEESYKNYTKQVEKLEETIRKQQESLGLAKSVLDRWKYAMDNMDTIIEVSNENKEPVYLYYPDEDFNPDIHTHLFSVSYWTTEFSVENGEPNYIETSFMLDKDFLRYLEEKSPNIRKREFPKGKCLYTAFCSELPEESPELVAPFIAYAKENNITLTEHIYVSYMYTFRKDGKRCHFYEAFLPIAEKGE
ncbi:MAG: MerR family transcriptional regulator [Firmicutes bacterium]|nr:MerR family transcriptional regulator [Bacillota bacterium]